MSNVKEITSEKEHDSLINENKLICIFFWAEFHEPSKRGGQMDSLFKSLSLKHHSITFVKVEAEAVFELSEKYNVEVSPTFVFINDKKIVSTLGGANVLELNKRIESLALSNKDNEDAKEKEKERKDLLTKRLNSLVNSSGIMLFMKGTIAEPRCGFSAKAVELLNENNIDYGSFDILKDNEVRQGLKEKFDWQTYPMLIVKGNLVGGIDVMEEMNDNKELIKLKEISTQSLNERIKALLNSHEVLLFMKGDKKEAKCGFSNSMMLLLNESEIEYETFDILLDQQIRQGLKEYSNWPTYPQLYVQGKLIGGLDILKEMKEEGDLIGQLGISKKENLNDKLERLINQDKVVLFMKGEPSSPKCGFSSKMVGILDSINVKFSYFDILTDEKVREGLKAYSSWPTYPQLYVNGKLVGGLDIVKELQEEGELADLFVEESHGHSHGGVQCSGHH